MPTPFSSRFGYSNDSQVPIVARHDAPDQLRGVLPLIAYEVGFRPTQLREIVCRVLREVPKKSNWTEYPNVNGEVVDLVANCDWYKVYDIIEALAAALRAGSLVSSDMRGTVEAADLFENELNRFFRETGLGWQLSGGHVEVRGSEIFEDITRGAVDELAERQRQTASKELHEALRDLSRRPDPDISGAIQHSIAALECVARAAAGDSKATLGELLKKHPQLLPKPIDSAVEKVWGYASEVGRHLREGNEPKYDEAELLVGFAGAACRYLAKKWPSDE